jgi:Predicted membrane protein
MSFDPLFAAPAVIQIHAFLALAAVALTACILTLRKGSSLHRTLGWTWVLMMAAVALSSFWINQIRWIGPFGPIHILSAVTLISLVLGVRAARRHERGTHARIMRTLVFGALIIAGGFTLLPGRIMHAVVFGVAS